MGLTSPVMATTYDISEDSTLVGRLRVVIPTGENTLFDVARQLDVGVHEITWANPGVDPWVPGERHIVVPTRHILPPKPWTGIILNVPQRRLFYFPPPSKGQRRQVITFPVSIAREGWSTPLGTTTVVAKHKDPAWFVPKSIREEHRKAGEPDFPDYFPPGPDNPMGMLAIQIGFPGIFIHGTNKPWGVGLRTSHGCLHLYPEDAARLFPLMQRGIPVRVINEPVIVGHDGERLYASHFEPVKEYGGSGDPQTRASRAISAYIRKDQSRASPRFDVDWKKVDAMVKQWQVVPYPLSMGSADLEEELRAMVPDLYNFEPYGMDANDASMPGH